jgi:phospholipid/cholesterol/gamma-HCH transport system substrate-binding protein
VSTASKDLPRPSPARSLTTADLPVRDSSSQHRRWLVAAALAAVILAVIVAYVLSRPADYHYRFVFTNAGQLVNGDLVRIGGTSAGSVTSVGLSSNGLAEIGVKLHRSFGPLRDGTTVTLRQAGLVGIANRYVDVSPAPSFRPALPDGAVIGVGQTSSVVEIDQLFNTLDANTRQGLKRVIRGFAGWYVGRSTQANLSAQYFPPALQAYTRFFNQLGADSPTLTQFIDQTGRALGSLTQHRAALTDLITQSRLTTQALGADQAALSQALQYLPPALRKGTATFSHLRATLPDLQHLVDVSGSATRHLAPFLTRLQPTLNEAVPNFTLLRQIFNKPGPNNDLYDALRDLPALAQLTTSSFPHAQDALLQSTPIFSFARPYIPDLVGWVSNWSGIFGPYDANGHYARTVPVFDAFSFADNSQGGTLTPKPPDQRGSGGALQTGFTQRCPGGAIRPPADHSAPFVDNGPLANPACRPSQTIGGSP